MSKSGAPRIDVPREAPARGPRVYGMTIWAGGSEQYAATSWPDRLSPHPASPPSPQPVREGSVSRTAVTIVRSTPGLAVPMLGSPDICQDPSCLPVSYPFAQDARHGAEQKGRT